MASVQLDRDAAKSGDLPDVCVYCGAPATALQRRVFSGRTPFTITVGGGMPRARLPVCDRHRAHTLKRRLAQIGLAGLLVALAILLSLVDAKGGAPDWIADVKPYRGALILSMLAVFAALIVVRFVAFYTDVRLTSATWSSLTLAGVADAFARACRGEHYDAGRASGPSREILDVLPVDQAARPARATPRAQARKSAGAGRGLVVGILVAGLLGLLLCAGAVGLFLKMRTADGPVTLSNARITSALGIAIHIQAEYRCQTTLAPDREYVLVIEQEGRKIAQRSFPGSVLHERGTLDIDVLGNLYKRGAGLTAFIEERVPQQEGIAQRVSNVVSVKSGR
jgi:hypothetical protein